MAVEAQAGHMGLHGTIESLLDRGETVALVTVTDVDGSAPQDPGAEMVVESDGSIHGTVGGGTVEELSRKAALEAIDEKRPRTEHWELTPDGNTGMVCGGEMTVFINVMRGRRRLIVAGGGHIGEVLVGLAGEMGYDVAVVDDRADYADPDRFDDEVTVVAGAYDEGIAEVGVTDNTAVAVATRSGTTDRIAARAGLLGGAFYVGVVASDRKAARIRDGLVDDGVDDSLVERLCSPAGIDLGGAGPEHVALSMLAEITAVRHGGSGEHMDGR